MSGAATDPAVRAALVTDLPACTAIYNEAVRTSVATFDLEEVGADRFEGTVDSADPLELLLVAERDGAVLGYAGSHTYRVRPAYAQTRETSIYLAPGARGAGVGRLLYGHLLAGLDAAGCHTVLALVARPNDASEALHRSLGFTHVGTMREVGHKLGRWVDTAWYQRFPAARS